jgi:hypothetical protein
MAYMEVNNVVVGDFVEYFKNILGPKYSSSENIDKSISFMSMSQTNPNYRAIYNDSLQQFLIIEQNLMDEYYIEYIYKFVDNNWQKQ